MKLRMEVDGRHPEPQLGLEREELEAHHPADRVDAVDEAVHGDTQLDPVAPLAGLERELAPADPDLERAASGFERHRDRDLALDASVPQPLLDFLADAPPLVGVRDPFRRAL